jgi:hypothetical protein
MSKEAWYEAERAGHGLYPSNTPLTSYASKSLKLSLIHSDFWPRNNTLSVAGICYLGHGQFYVGKIFKEEVALLFLKGHYGNIYFGNSNKGEDGV